MVRQLLVKSESEVIGKMRKRQSTTRSAGPRVAVAWYAPEDWERVRNVAADPAALEPTYDEWLQMATDALDKLNAQGVHPERINVRASELKHWCDEHGRPVDGSARAAFAAEKLREKYDPRKP